MTAAVREDATLMTLLDSIKPKAVPAAAVNTALIHAVQQRKIGWLAELCQQRAAKACDTAVVVPLLVEALKLETASRWSTSSYVQPLFHMPGLQERLQPPQVARLLCEALKRNVGGAPGAGQAEHLFMALLQLPPAQQLEQVHFAELLSIASIGFEARRSVMKCHWSYDWYTREASLAAVLLKQLRMHAAHMNYPTVYAMFKVAVQQWDLEAAVQYARLRAVHAAEPSQVQQLLLLALEMCGTACHLDTTMQLSDCSSSSSTDMVTIAATFEALCYLPSTQQLSHGMIEGLFKAGLGFMG
jgi:hypothetical protein